MNQNDEVSRHVLIVPCYFADKNETVPMLRKMCLEISKISYEIRVLLSLDNPTLVSTDFRKFDTLYAYTEHCVFSSSKNLQPDITIFFLNLKIHYMRLLFTLADSGLIIPKQYNKCLLMPSPSFVPSGIYSYQSSKYMAEIRTIISNRFGQIKQIPHPFCPDLVREAIYFFNRLYVIKIRKWLDNNPNEKVFNLELNSKILLNWLKKRAPPRKSQYSKNKSKLYDFSKLQAKELPKEIRTIKQDSDRTHSEDPKWNDKLKAQCENVMQAFTFDGHVFLQGEFDVAQKIALLLQGSSGIINDRTEIPNWAKNLSEETSNEFFYSIIKFMLSLFDHKEKNLMEVLIDITEISKELIHTVFPRLEFYINTYFGTEKNGPNSNVFLWIGNDLYTFYCRRYPDVWRLWFWIFCQDDSFHRFAVFSTSLLFLSLPKFAEHYVTQVDEVTNLWTECIESIDFETALNCANYIYLQDKELKRRKKDT